MNHVAVDIENAGPVITLVSLSTQEETWAGDWSHTTKALVAEAMGNPERWKIAHNWSHELSYFKRYDIDVPGRIYDTMLASHLLQPDLGKALEKSVTLYVDARPFKHLSTSVPERPAHDAYFARRMFEVQWPLLESQGMLRLFTSTIMPATRVLLKWTERGIKVDLRRAEEWRTELSGEKIRLQEKWHSMAGNINPFSPSQLAKFFFEKQGMPRVSGGSVNEHVIKTLLSRFPQNTELLETLLELRGTAKMLSTYAETELGSDLCVHPKYLPVSKDSDQAGAVSGRIASNDPNIQNQPPVARRMYVSHIPGGSIVEADFGQIELRIAAALSGDQNLLRDLSGADVFGRFMHVLSCDRVRAKNVVYGSIYGASPGEIVNQLHKEGIHATKEECSALQDTLARSHPRLWAWRQEVVTTAENQLYLSNPFGRRRYFYSKRTAPEALNFLPQSTAADILWALIRPLDDAVRSAGGFVLTTVHDSVVAEAAPGCEDAVAQALRDTMECEWPIIAPEFKVPVKITRGQSWGEVC